MNYLKTALNAFYKPDEVYNETKEERLSESFKFFITLMAIATVFIFLKLILRNDLSVGTAVGLTILIFIGNIILTFAVTGIYHLFVILLGGKEGFSATFKAFAYVESFSVVIAILSLILPNSASFINNIILLWSLGILLTLFEKYTGLGLGKGLGAFVLGTITTLILAGIIGMIVGFGTFMTLMGGALH